MIHSDPTLSNVIIENNTAPQAGMTVSITLPFEVHIPAKPKAK